MANQISFNDKIINVGDIIAVHHLVREGEKVRTQVFEGVVLAIRGKDSGKSLTVRKVSGGVGVERIWPIICPTVTKIVVKKKQPAKRGKLYYLRDRVGKIALKAKKRTEIKIKDTAAKEV